MHILLLGVYGSGKSTVGRLLAERTGRAFVEMDALIARTLGVSSPDNVPTVLWKECQIDVCKDLSVQENFVIAASGNIVENDINVLHFHTHSPNTRMVYLRTSAETLVARTVSESHGNLEDAKRDLHEKIDQRERLHLRFANMTIDTDGKNPLQIVDEILASLPPNIAP